MTTQWLRKVSLVVAKNDQGLDLSNMQIQFHVRQNELMTPNNATIRVINLSGKTSKSLLGEFDRVVLQAGYENGPFGIIFDGTIKQVKRGRINATDTYADIFAADGDLAHNFGVTNTSLAAGSTPGDSLKAHVAGLKSAEPGINVGYAPGVPLGPALPRGKVEFGMSRDGMRRFANTYNYSWSIQNGQVTLVPQTSYRDGEAVVLTSKTGMIGLPEQTDNGVTVQCLLNPKIVVGGKIHIDEKSVQAAAITPVLGQINYLASISRDGFYKAYVVEHEGDTRGQSWYSNLTCFAIDVSAPAPDSVSPYGTFGDIGL